MDNLKPLVNNKELWEAYLSYLDKEIKQEQKNFEQANPEDLPIIRERIKTLRKLENLRNIVNARK